MAKRVTIGGSGPSPFRVSVAGVDADLAEFNNLIFDGNQPPLRLYATGWIGVSGITWNDYAGGRNTSEGSAFPTIASPVGTAPIWLSTFTYQTNGFNWTPSHNNNVNDGAGSAICQYLGTNYFVPISHKVGAPGAPTTPGATAYINYAIMKNWT